jgi:hypothetical protein
MLPLSLTIKHSVHFGTNTDTHSFSGLVLQFPDMHDSGRHIQKLTDTVSAVVSFNSAMFIRV